MNVTRTGIVLKPDASRVLFRPFNPPGDERPLRILARVLAFAVICAAAVAICALRAAPQVAVTHSQGILH